MNIGSQLTRKGSRRSQGTTRYHRNGRKLRLVGGLYIYIYHPLYCKEDLENPRVFPSFPGKCSSFARTTPLELPKPSKKCGRSRANGPGATGSVELLWFAKLEMEGSLFWGYCNSFRTFPLVCRLSSSAAFALRLLWAQRGPSCTAEAGATP